MKQSFNVKRDPASKTLGFEDTALGSFITSNYSCDGGLDSQRISLQGIWSLLRKERKWGETEGGNEERNRVKEDRRRQDKRERELSKNQTKQNKSKCSDMQLSWLAGWLVGWFTSLCCTL